MITDYSCADATWIDQSRIIISVLGIRLGRRDLLSRVVWDSHRYITLSSPQGR